MVVATVVVVLWVTGAAPSTGQLRRWGDDLGAWGVLVWPLLFGALNFMIPWPLIAGATGAVFGTAGGTALALAGVLVAASLQFAVARTVSGEDLRRRARARVPRVDALLERNGFLAVFYSRIAPGVSWGMVNYAAGLLGVRLRDVGAATVVGGTPKVFAYVALGGSFHDLSRPEALVAIGLLAVLALGGAVMARRQLSGP